MAKTHRSLVVLAGLTMLFGALMASPGHAEEQLLETRIGAYSALGDLVKPEEAAPDAPLVLLVHGSLAHKDMELVDAMQAALAERGLPSLAITLTLNVDRRQGMYDCALPHTHQLEDASAEIGHWLALAKSQLGFDRIVLAGHSRGGLQVARFVATGTDPAVVAGVLMAPATGQSSLSAGAGTILDSAFDLVTSGQADRLMELPAFLYCKNAKASATSVISYYGAGGRHDTVALLPDIALPVLVIAGSQDRVVPDLPARMPEVAENNEAIRFELIEDAGHLFLDFYTEDAADLVIEFLASAAD